MSLFDEPQEIPPQEKIIAEKKSSSEINLSYEDNLKNSLWVERYRPKNIDEYVGDEGFKSRIKKIIDSGDVGNLLLYGPPGTGKTSTAKMIVNSLHCDHLYINASSENGIDVIRDKVTTFAMATGYNSLKIIILDEFSEVSSQAQGALRAVIESYSHHTRFILTANAVERIHPAIISRCQAEKVVPPSKPHIAKHLVGILTKEGVKFDIKDVAKVINIHYPDIRKCIGTIQQFSKVNNELALDSGKMVDSNVPAKIVDVLKSDSGNKFNEIRQLVADAGAYNFDTHYKYLFDTVDSWAGDKVCSAVVILADMQYKSGVVPDREINFMSCMAQLIELK